jgi:hypothetical protein
LVPTPLRDNVPVASGSAGALGPDQRLRMTVTSGELRRRNPALLRHALRRRGKELPNLLLEIFG